jgi:predicted porin
MHSGQFAYGEFGQGRSKNSIQYATPDLSGFRGAFLIQADSSKDGEGDVKGSTERTLDGTRKEVVVGENGSGVSAPSTLTLHVPGKAADKGNNDDTDIDHWSLAAAYDIAGFSMGASYSVFPDAVAGSGSKYNGMAKKAAVANGLTLATPYDTNKDDLTAWAVKLGYSQDNWYVNSWYGERSMSDLGTAKAAQGTLSVDMPVGDVEVFSIAGGISVDKVAVYALYENKEHTFFVNEDKEDGHEYDDIKRGDDAYYTLGVQYTLGSNSWTWVEYAGQDVDSSTSEDDTFTIGLGHSF